MARYPTGLTRPLPEPGENAPTWAKRLALDLDDQPLGHTAPCLNPECTGPVDFIPNRGPGPLYCSHACRSRTSDLRQRATQQLEVITTALTLPASKTRGLNRADLRARARHLRWWLARLTSPLEEESRQRSKTRA